MSYCYIPGSGGGNPLRALKILIRTLLWASGIGFVYMIVKKIFTGQP